jgi:L-threonylcarbamoyladenylate synthase
MLDVFEPFKLRLRLMKTELLSTHTPELFAAAVKRAAELLRAGELVALPTETVYGLAANALNDSAVAKIFQIKGRPANNPIIVHVAGLEMARRCVREFPAAAEPLAKSFWPGPLTLVLARSQKSEVRSQESGIGGSSGLRPPDSGFWISDLVTAGGDTVGIRWPSHPFIQAVIRKCNFPLAAPSANLSERVSPTNAEHVRAQLDGKIPLIVDGGQSQVGIESTVLDLTVSPPNILRPGMIHAESLGAVVGNIQHPTSNIQHPMLRSPGLLVKHYSPKAKLVILNWRDDADLRRQLSTLNPQLSTVHVIAHTHIPSGEQLGGVSVMPHDAEAFARALYAELHRCDEAGAKVIVVEALPDSPEWAGIADRLRRAAA